MKAFSIAALTLASFSIFAAPNTKCEKAVYQEIMSSKIIKGRLEILLADAEENFDKISAITIKAKELAAEVCDK